jgi:hypothetical protein
MHLWSQFSLSSVYWWRLTRRKVLSHTFFSKRVRHLKISVGHIKICISDDLFFYWWATCFCHPGENMFLAMLCDSRNHFQEKFQLEYVLETRAQESSPQVRSSPSQLQCKKICEFDSEFDWLEKDSKNWTTVDKTVWYRRIGKFHSQYVKVWFSMSHLINISNETLTLKALVLAQGTEICVQMVTMASMSVFGEKNGMILCSTNQHRTSSIKIQYKKRFFPMQQ